MIEEDGRFSTLEAVRGVGGDGIWEPFIGKEMEDGDLLSGVRDLIGDGR